MAVFAWSAYGARADALDDYLRKDDAHFGWAVQESGARPEGSYHLLVVTSQAWRTERDVTPAVWLHTLEIYVPSKVDHDAALLSIDGGTRGDDLPKMPDGGLGGMAVRARAVTARLRQVPNQPLVFAGDATARSRKEDQILSYAWNRNLESADPSWLALMPMVKSAVRAMDVVQRFCASEAGGGATVRRFVLTGASKRGWTSWLAASADPRVAGVAPRVIDLLNMPPSFRHHRAAYGRYADAVQDYVRFGIPERMGRPEMEASLEILDPWRRRDRLAMPKMIVNSTGDQFFLPDSWRFYWNDLPGPKYLRYIPNTDHGLNGSANDTVEAFFRCLMAGRKMPSFSWREVSPGRLRVEKAEPAPLRAVAWRAANPNARDFMLKSIGPVWTSRDIRPSSGGVYEDAVPEPSAGWSALLIELHFPDPLGGAAPLVLTTGVSVTPAALPYAASGE